jgi:hypothetical protein
MRVDIDSGPVTVTTNIENVQFSPLNLNVIARTNGLFIHIGNGFGDALMVQTTVEFADRLAVAIKRETRKWKSRVRAS